MKSPSVDSLVQDIIAEGRITRDRVISDVTTLQNNPFEVLGYLNRISTFINLDLDTVTFDNDVFEIVTTLQRPAIVQAQYMAERDGLTGAYNRMHMESNLRASDSIYSVLMVDIDNFKKVNDNNGHQIGDYVIQNIVKIVQETLRESYVSRYGGEEFYIELNNVDAKNALKIAERLREKIRNEAVNYIKADLQKREISVDLSNLDSITVSIGIADNKMKESPHEVLKNADSALYSAKNSGRNKSVVYETKK